MNETTETKTEITPVEVAEETMLGDLMEAALQELREAQRPWQAMSEDDQDDAIQRIERRMKQTIRSAVNILATRDCLRVVATVDSVTFKDGAKVVLKAPASSQGIHNVADSCGQLVLIVMPDSEELTEQSHDHEPDPDQRDLEIAEPREAA